MSSGKPSATSSPSSWSSVVSASNAKISARETKKKPKREVTSPSSTAAASAAAGAQTTAPSPSKPSEDTKAILNQPTKAVQKNPVSWAALAAANAAQPTPRAAITLQKPPMATVNPKKDVQELKTPVIMAPVQRGLEGWAGLPHDIILHHLYSAIKHDSRSIKVARQVCRSWYNGILLPKISGAGIKDLATKLPILSAASRHCEEILLDTHLRSAPNARASIACGENVRSIIVEGFWSVDSLLRLISPSPKLQSFTWREYFVERNMLESLKPLREARDLREVNLEVSAGQAQHHMEFLGLLATLPVKNLCLSALIMEADVAEALASWISSSTVLESLELRSVSDSLNNFALIKSIGNNRSLKKLIWKESPGCREVLNVVVGHPSIKQFAYSSIEIPYAKDALDFYIAADNLESFNFDHQTLAYSAPQYSNATGRSWIECIMRGRNFSGSNVGDIARASKTRIGEVTDALKKDPKFKDFIISSSWIFSGYMASDPAFLFAKHLLDSSTYIESMEICRLADGREEDIRKMCEGLARARALKKFKMIYTANQLSNLAVDTLFGALAKIPTLEQIQISGRVPHGSVAHLCSAIKRFKKLNFIELIDSQIEADKVVDILLAATEAKCVKVLHLPRASIKATNVAFNNALRDCVKNCPLESLSFFGAALDGTTVNALIRALRELPECNLKFLDLLEVNVHPLVQKNVDLFIDDMAGLVTLNRTFEEDTYTWDNVRRINAIYKL